MYLPRYQLYLCNRVVHVCCCVCDSSLRNLKNKYEWSLRLSVSISPEQDTMSSGSGGWGWSGLGAVASGRSSQLWGSAAVRGPVARLSSLYLLLLVTPPTSIHLTINLIAGPSSIISSATATQQPQLGDCRLESCVQRHYWSPMYSCLLPHI